MCTATGNTAAAGFVTDGRTVAGTAGVEPVTSGSCADNASGDVGALDTLAGRALFRDCILLPALPCIDTSQILHASSGVHTRSI